MTGLAGIKQVCVAYKKGPSGKLRCADKQPRSGHCYDVKMPGKSRPKRVCGSSASPISKRSKTYKRVSKAGFVAGLCRKRNGQFKKGCKRSKKG